MVVDQTNNSIQISCGNHLENLIIMELPHRHRHYLVTMKRSLYLLGNLKNSIQYVSDVHVDIHKTIPKIKPLSRYLAVCGDVGIPSSPYWKAFMTQVSQDFEKVFFVPGNHDFDLGPIYRQYQVQKWTPIMKEICESLGNVHYLNKDSYYLEKEKIKILGATLWSRAFPSVNNQSFHEGNLMEHQSHVDWFAENIAQHKKTQTEDDLVILTHFVPTFQLIEEKYKNYTNALIRTSRFATDLERFLINPPVKVWICGHSHSVINCTINNVYCAINAYKYKNPSSCVIEF